MNWDDEVDRAFERRREELLGEMIQEGRLVITNLGALASACAAQHPAVLTSSGFVAGVCLTIRRAPAPVAAPHRRSRLLRTTLAVLRHLPLGALLLA